MKADTSTLPGLARPLSSAFQLPHCLPRWRAVAAQPE